MAQYYVYILASSRNGTLYIGVTNDIARRIYEHKSGFVSGFTSNHNVKRLVHVETFDHPSDAIRREKRLKEWQRNWKVALVEKHNPFWRDLYQDILK